MRAGDIVRFRKNRIGQVYRVNPTSSEMTAPALGLLIEYQKWEKVATVLCQGKLIRVAADHIEKAGKKDGLQS